MKFYVGSTDSNWFQYLAKAQPDEVNFWKPSGKCLRRYKKMIYSRFNYIALITL